jgi:hypothetical protein
MRGVKGKKRKRRTEPDSKAQSKRFIKAAKALDVDESGEAFKRALDKLVPRKRKGG